MARTQSKKRRLFGFVKTSDSTAGLASSAGRFEARAGHSAVMSETSSMASPSRLARMKRFFNRSHQGPSSVTTAEIADTLTGEGAQDHQEQAQLAPDQEAVASSTSGGAQGQQEQLLTIPTKGAEKSIANPEPEPTPVSAGKDIDAAVKQFGGIHPIPHIAQVAVDAIDNANTTFSGFQHLSDTYLKPFKVFNQVVSTLANVHPYAQAALGILTATSQLVINQANIDNAVSDLLNKVQSVYEFLTKDESINSIDKMRVVLGRMSRAISQSAQFINNYSATKSFWRRAGKNIFSETQTVVDGYVKTLDNLMQQYRDGAILDTQVNTYRIAEDLNRISESLNRMYEDFNLDGMAYADGAGLNLTKKCLDGTRTEILREIMNWIYNPDDNAPRILWLHGQAGRGKSAIAHTIASWIEDVGGLGSCFCFARDRQTERREEKVLTTIACDLADREPAFRRALSDIVANKRSLKTTPDVTQQWQRLILEPLSKIDGMVLGKVVVVIDALDESGPDTSREHILSLLTSAEAAHLPSNFRILLTSRPLSDIKGFLSNAMHVKPVSLDNISAQSAESDIRLYVSLELCHYPEIGGAEVQSIAQKADGLFEWARLACRFIKPNKPGRTLMERYNEVMLSHSGAGGTLLDVMYKTILQEIMPQDEGALARFYSVMQQIMLTSEPLQLDTLDEMRSHFPPEDRFDTTVILEFMAPLLSGIADRSSVVRPLHASFYDFLTDQKRSGAYFVGVSGMHRLLAFASLQTLCNDLRFNICGLESSHYSNSEVVDLQEKINRNISPNLSYSCQFWGHHLGRTEFDLMLATMVEGIIGCEKLLFWFETLSLLSRLRHATSSLTSTIKWLQDQNGVDNVLAFAQDGIKFLQNFGSIISHSTPHLYISALPFTPSNTVLSRVLIPRFCHLVGVPVGGLKEWPAAQLVLYGHTSEVRSVVFSPDGKRTVSGSPDQTVRIWDAERGVQIRGSLEGHTDQVLSVGYSPDGKRIVSGSKDQTIRIWDAEGGVQIGSPLEGHTDWVSSVGFSPDGRRIVSGSDDQTVRIWDVETGVQTGDPLEGHTGQVLSVGFSPDGKRIVSGSKDQTIRIWDAERGVQIGDPLEGHTGPVSSVGFSPDGKWIVSGSFDQTVRTWDAESGVQRGGLLEGHTAQVLSIGFSPDGKRIVSGSSDSTVRIWDAERGIQIGGPLEGHTAEVLSVGFSPDGKRIVSGSMDQTMMFWDAEREVQIEGLLEGHTGQVLSVGFSPDGKRIVSGSSDQIVRIWDAERRVQMGNSLEGHGGPILSVGFSPDGKRIVSGSLYQTVKIWDAERGRQIGGPLEGHTGWALSVGFSPDGKRIVSGSSDKTVRIWDAEGRAQIGGFLEGHTALVSSVGFSPDGKRIVSGSFDQTVRIWDAERGVQIGDSLEGHTDWVMSVGYSPDGKRIVSGSKDQTVRIWDAERGVQIGGPLGGHTGGVLSVAFSCDGMRIVSGSSDQTVRIWDAERGVQIGGPLEGHAGGVLSVAFSPDGKRIVSGSSDQIVRIWNAERGVQIACSVCFSPVPSHALHDSQQLLHDIQQEDVNHVVTHEPVQLFNDGWIRGPEGRLLLWIPPTLWRSFYSKWTIAIIPKGRGMELDMNQMVHGDQWHQCFK